MSRDAGPFGPTDPRTTETPAGEAQLRSYWLRSSSVPDVSPTESAADGVSGISSGPGVPTRPDQVSSAPPPLFPDSPPSPVMSPREPNPEPTTQAQTPTLVTTHKGSDQTPVSCDTPIGAPPTVADTRYSGLLAESTISTCALPWPSHVPLSAATDAIPALRVLVPPLRGTSIQNTRTPTP